MGFRLLGPVQVLDPAGGVVPLRGRMDRALLAVLLLNANRQVPTDAIVNALWDVSPPKAETYWTYVKRLRRLLRAVFGGRVVMPSLRGASAIEVDVEEIDYFRFVGHLERARVAGDPVEAAGHARRALAEWAGAALQDLSDDQQWVTEHRRGLDVRRAEAWHLLVDAELASGRPAAALATVNEPLGLWPYDETLVGQQLLALSRTGRQTEALSRFRDFRRRLVDELGVEPGAGLVALQQTILHGGASPGTTAITVTERPVPAPGPVCGLPPRTVFTGRQGTVDELLSVLNPANPGVRAAVVAGLAGAGKSVLVVEAAHRAREHGWFGGGVLFLDVRAGEPGRGLATGRALGALLGSFGAAAGPVPLGTREREHRYRSLLAASSEPVLVVLDDVDCAEQVRSLLPGAGRHAVLVTSRRLLTGLDGSRLVHLGTPGGEEAAAMLRGHVLAAVPGDPRLDAEPEAVARVVRSCGYLPLALRAAAARLAEDPAMPVAELAAVLEGPGRLAALTIDGQPVVTNAFAGACRRLGQDQLRLLRRLAAHPEAEIDAGTAVLDGMGTAGVTPLFDELRRAHLLTPGTLRGRWRIPELVRLFAAGRDFVVRRGDTPEEGRRPDHAVPLLYPLSTPSPSPQCG
ncbi:BTAD domain-containing putative transcriptional regulator [Amycolatopsis sp. NPDC059021]|uniref:AfsR/SARP family transcriptional regulator n=1 Tax=Amycolatopsis sp. NPDC059021 TaxID=3346704 RepID=UPI003671F627